MTSRQGRGMSPLLGLFLGLLVVALGVGGWVAWQVWGTTALAQRAAREQANELAVRWAAEPAPSPSASGEPQPRVLTDLEQGRAEWLLRFPTLDESYQWPIAVGVDADVLDGAVGWYPGTAQPGQVGNFAVAGYRLTHGEPFARIAELREGDKVVVEAADARFTYRIITAPTRLTVQDGDSWVLDPVPGQPDAVPSQAFLTLTTSEDLIPSTDRTVAFGLLEKTEMK